MLSKFPGTWSPSYISVVIMEQDLCEDEIDVECEYDSDDMRKQDSCEIDVECEYDSGDMRNLGNQTRGRVVNFVWDGWDAALIVSKRKKAQTVLGKRKCWEISSTDERDTTMTTKVSQPDQNMEEDNESMEFHSAMYYPEIDGSKSEKYMIAKAVATLS